MEIVFLFVGVGLGYMLDKSRTSSVIADAQQAADKVVERISSIGKNKLEEINFIENDDDSNKI